jgi:pyruvate dehydrogenase E2 component (dihydrolipoyllysine-residue acetyltransferase)
MSEATEAVTVPLGRIERRAAERLAHSRQTIPDFTLETEIDVTELEAWRRALTRGDAPHPTVNDVVIVAAARTLKDHPRLRGRFRGDHIEIAETVDVGFAVAGEGGLMVPVVHGADRLGLRETAARTSELAGRCRNGAIGVAEMLGGCFTVSNLGMLGVTRFEAVIDPDQAAILAVGAVRHELVRWEEEILDRLRMAGSLSVDHRVADGATAARFLRDLRRLLEQPVAGLGLDG